MLDTSVLIARERGAARWDRAVHDEDDVAMAAITLAELLVGVELADGRNRDRRGRYVADIVGAIPVVAYDADTAVTHARLLAAVRRGGRPRGAHDLVIAASAVASNRVVLTTDASGFSDLPDVDVRVL